jgi:thioredoxin 1
MASENVKEFTQANWDQEVVKSEVPVLVDFWAAWCGPCRALAPTVDKIAAQFAGKLKVGKVNIDENGELANKYAISSIPQLFLFKGGDQPKERLVGLQSESAIAKVVNRLLEA